MGGVFLGGSGTRIVLVGADLLGELNGICEESEENQTSCIMQGLQIFLKHIFPTLGKKKNETVQD